MIVCIFNTVPKIDSTPQTPKPPDPPLPSATLQTGADAPETDSSRNKGERVGKKRLQVPLNTGSTASGLGIPM
jgi:hypothetical protein